MSDPSVPSTPSDSASEPSWLTRAWSPPKVDKSSSAMMGEMKRDSATLWEALDAQALKAIEAGDEAALLALKDQGFFPERGAHPPGCSEGWFLEAFMRKGMKGLMPLVSVFRQQSREIPSLSDALSRARALDYSIPRLEEAMAHLPNAKGPWREFARYGQTDINFMFQVGFKIARRGLRSGWLGQEELGAGKVPVAVKLMGLCVQAVTLERQSRPSNKREAADARALVGEIVKIARAGGAGRPRSKDGDAELRKGLRVALIAGEPIESIQPAFDLIDLEWRKPVFKITFSAIAQANADSPLNNAAQAKAALAALSESFVGAMMRSQRPEAIETLAREGLLGDLPVTVWRQCENPLKARRHWVEACEAAGREVDMSKRFDGLRRSIEECDAPEEKKALWLSGFEQTPGGMPAEPRINLPFKDTLSVGALALALIADWKTAQPMCEALANAGVDLERALKQSETLLDVKHARSHPWMGPLIERQALALAAGPGRGASPKIRM